jgi:type IV fimbrial biogenesis protein FimT
VADQTGFTLVELMVVLAVVVILLLIAVPSFSDILDRDRVHGAADAAVALMADARGGAVQSNRDVAISFAGTDPAWCIGANGAVTPATLGTAIPAASACDCTTASNCTILNSTTAGNAGQQILALESTDYTGVTMSARPSSFTLDGRFGDVKTLSATSVTFTSPKGKYQIQMTVAPLGQASLCVPSGQPTIQGISSC